MSPFLQTRRRLLRRRSAFAILTGLLIHSLCNLFIDRRLFIRFGTHLKKQFYGYFFFVSKGRLRPTIKFQKTDYDQLLRVCTLVSGPTMSSTTFLTNAYFFLQSDKGYGVDYLHWKCEGPGASGAAIRPKRDVPRIRYMTGHRHWP